MEQTTVITTIVATEEELQKEFSLTLFDLFKQKITKQYGEDCIFSLEGTTFRAEKKSIFHLGLISEPLLSMTVSDLMNSIHRKGKIQARTLNYVIAGFGKDQLISDLIELPLKELMKFRNFGLQSYEDLMTALYQEGITNIFECPIGIYATFVYGLNRDTFEKIKNKILAQ